MPLLALRFDGWDWDPADKAIPKEEAETRFHFDNVGRGLAIIDVVWAEHWVYEEDGKVPSPVSPHGVREFRWLPHGVMVQLDKSSQEFQRRPRDKVSYDTFHEIKKPAWIFQGFVLYRSVTGGLYQTGFCYYFDREAKTFYLGPIEGEEGQKYNYTRKLDRKAWRRDDEERFLRSLYD